jgi:hypothetical protein
MVISRCSDFYRQRCGAAPFFCDACSGQKLDAASAMTHDVTGKNF